MDLVEGVDPFASLDSMDVGEGMDPFREAGMIGDSLTGPHGGNATPLVVGLGGVTPPDVGLGGVTPPAVGDVTPLAVGLGDTTPPGVPLCRVQTTPPPSPPPDDGPVVVVPPADAPTMATEIVAALGFAIDADRVAAVAAADEMAIAVEQADDAHAEPPRPSWLVGVPDRMLDTGRPVEDAFRGMSELQVQVCLKYGHEHIRSTVTVDSVLSIRRRGAEGLFRPLDRSLRPATSLTEALLSDLRGDAHQVSEELLGFVRKHNENNAESMNFETDEANDDLPPPSPEQRAPREPPMEFFKVVLKGPSRIKGQPRDQDSGLRSEEIVVAKQAFCLKSDGDIFLFTEPIERHRDIQLLAPSDGLLSRLTTWQIHPEKYYWNASLAVGKPFQRAAMETVKLLMDANAVEGRGDPFNVSDTEQTRSQPWLS